MELTETPLSEPAMMAAVEDGGAGAIVLFSGVVRDQTGGRRVKFLEYEAHGPMAVGKMREIAAAARTRFPGIRLDTEWPQDTIPKIGLDHYTAVVALAHVGHIDDEALKLALRSNCFYIGALGSKRTHAKRTQRLKEAGFTHEEIARVHCPIGINIGAQSPPEIAVSIMAEVVLALRGPRVFRPA